MLPPGLQTPREVVLYYDDVYFSLVNSGRAHPFIYPWATVGAALAFAYLLVDHRRSPFLKWCRYPMFGFLLAFQAWTIATNRARNPASAFGVGLLSAWGVLWVGSIMIANDCQTDFKRIERADGAGDVSGDTDRSPANGVAANGAAPKPHDEGLRQRKNAAATEQNASTNGPACRTGPLFWQSYPSSSFIERLDWVADVFCSFRGVGWSFETYGIPPLPSAVEAQLHGLDPTEHPYEAVKVSRSGVRRYGDRAALLRQTAINLVIGYIALDFVTCVMHHDPYFFGYGMHAPLPAYLPPIMHGSEFLMKSYRLLTSLAGIYTALWTIFGLGPAFFCGVLGPKWIGVRGEAWLNPADAYGSYTSVLEKGLAGWWGEWWHQTFRFAFETPATRILDIAGISKRSPTGRTVSLLIAFFLSGCLHASGSYTQLGETRPMRGPMAFFLLQAVGIWVQTAMVQQLRSAGVVDKTPRTLRRIVNLLVVHIWLYWTAPLLVDDFAAGGIWLFEPIPFSPLRGLGFGAKDDQFFCWWHGLAWWRTGKHWWDSGIAL